jgi:hypothetical protein
MSKYEGSGFMPVLKGKLAGSVFQRNRYGNIIRNKTIPINPNTLDQQQVRLNVADLSKTWGTLSVNQRDRWSQVALDFPLVRGGRTYVLNGFMFFMKLNRCLQEIEEAIILDAPQIGKPQKFDSFSVDTVTTPGLEDIKLNISPAIDSGTKLRVYATRVLKPGVENFATKFNKIGIIDHSFISGGSIKVIYTDKYGNMPLTGDKAFFGVVSTLTASGFSEIMMTCRSVGAV